MYSPAVPDPLAYFITWTTYGTRLHGDDRGSVDCMNNTPGTPFSPPDPELEAAMRASMIFAPIVLDEVMRGVVTTALRDHIAFRKWNERALNVRTTHVHIVLDCRGDTMRSPERVMEELKYWATRRLREAGLVRLEGHIWTDHGSTRWINDERGLAGAIDYVLNQQ
jgi:hypothetical protein